MRLRTLARRRSRRSELRSPFGKRTLIRTPDDLTVSRHGDTKRSNQLLQAAIEERARRLAEERKNTPPPDRSEIRQRRLAALKAAGKFKTKYRIVRETLEGDERLSAPPDDKKARRWTVRGGLWLWIAIFGSLAVGILIRENLPQFVKDGGIIVAGLIAMQLIVVIIILERMWTIKGARGKESLAVFTKKLQGMIQK